MNMMKVILVGAVITTVIAFAGVIATWSVIYSTDIGSGKNFPLILNHKESKL